jgi:hypothetical protein
MVKDVLLNGKLGCLQVYPDVDNIGDYNTGKLGTNTGLKFISNTKFQCKSMNVPGIGIIYVGDQITLESGLVFVIEMFLQMEPDVIYY